MTAPALPLGRPARTLPPARRPARATRPARARAATPATRSTVTAPIVPYLLVLGALLAAGLLGALLVNTASAQGAFTARALQKQVAALTVERQRLEAAVAVDDSPLTLAARARSMGLVQASVPAFVRLSDGAVLGVPTAVNSSPAPAPHVPGVRPPASRAVAAALHKPAAPAATARSHAPTAGAPHAATGRPATPAPPAAARPAGKASPAHAAPGSTPHRRRP